MNAKFYIALVAVLVAAPASYAAQPFGRDSVYVTPGTHVSKAQPGPAVAGFGRDSVYATQGVGSKPTSTNIRQTEVTYKAGRA
jgi:hypothetical protein